METDVQEGSSWLRACRHPTVKSLALSFLLDGVGLYMHSDKSGSLVFPFQLHVERLFGHLQRAIKRLIPTDEPARVHEYATRNTRDL